ncbi:MAG: hypothetical protein U0U69_02190 [Acidimicrobiia bacterium]
MAPMAVDVGQHPVILVAGPSGSGKTAALARRSRGPVAPRPVRAYLFAETLDARRPGGLDRGRPRPRRVRGLADLVDVVEKRRLESESSAELPEPLLVVVDDGDEIGRCASALEQVLQQARRRCRLVLAGSRTCLAPSAGSSTR